MHPAYVQRKCCHNRSLSKDPNQRIQLYKLTPLAVRFANTISLLVLSDFCVEDLPVTFV